MNKAMLIGHLGADPEIREAAEGRPVANLSVATTEHWRKRGSEALESRTEWHRVVCFGRLAEITGAYLHKGSKVFIEGRMQTRKWQDPEGQDRYTTEIVARSLELLDRKPADSSAGHAPADAGPAAVFDDDIPF